LGVVKTKLLERLFGSLPLHVLYELGKLGISLRHIIDQSIGVTIGRLFDAVKLGSQRLHWNLGLLLLSELIHECHCCLLTIH